MLKWKKQGQYYVCDDFEIRPAYNLNRKFCGWELRWLGVFSHQGLIVARLKDAKAQAEVIADERLSSD